jgi:hypothetical protein
MPTQEQIQQIQYPTWVQQPAETLLNTMTGLMGQPLSIPGQQVAGFTPTQTAAMQQAYGGIGAYQPYLQAAGTGQQAAMGAMGAGVGALGGMQFDPSGVTPWMNQYQGDVTQEALAEIDRQAAMAQNRLGGQAAQAGAFGGSRFGIQQSELARGAQDLKSRRIFEDMSRNYQQALGAMQAANQQQLQQGQAFGQLGQATSGIAGAMAGLGGQAQAMGQSDVNQLMGIGGMQQQLGQTQMTADYQNQLALANAPFQQLSTGAGILQQLSPQVMGQQVTAPLPQSNPWMSGISTAGTLYGMGQGLGSLIG